MLRLDLARAQRLLPPVEGVVLREGQVVGGRAVVLVDGGPVASSEQPLATVGLRLAVPVAELRPGVMTCGLPALDPRLLDLVEDHGDVFGLLHAGLLVGLAEADLDGARRFDRVPDHSVARAHFAAVLEVVVESLAGQQVLVEPAVPPLDRSVAAGVAGAAEVTTGLRLLPATSPLLVGAVNGPGAGHGLDADDLLFPVRVTLGVVVGDLVVGQVFAVAGVPHAEPSVVVSPDLVGLHGDDVGGRGLTLAPGLLDRLELPEELQQHLPLLGADPSGVGVAVVVVVDLECRGASHDITSLK